MGELLEDGVEGVHLPALLQHLGQKEEHSLEGEQHQVELLSLGAGHSVGANQLADGAKAAALAAAAVVVASLTEAAPAMEAPRLAGVQLNEGVKEDVKDDRVVVVEELLLIDKLSGGWKMEKMRVSLVKLKD